MRYHIRNETDGTVLTDQTVDTFERAEIRAIALSESQPGKTFRIYWGHPSNPTGHTVPGPEYIF